MKYGFNKMLVTMNFCLVLFKQRVKDNFIQLWNSELSDSTWTLFYRNISDFGFQSYLDVQVKKFRIALSRLRMSSHRLEVEMGKWMRPVRVQYDECKCRMCGLLEDEFHFLLECHIHRNLRNMYTKKYCCAHPSMFKLLELFSVSNKKVIRNLATYVFKAFDERNKTLYFQLT